MTTTTQATDSRELLVTALRTVERLRAKLSASRDGWLDEPIAIVGIGCRLPGGVDSPESYWQLLRNAVDATGEFPARRADARALYSPDPDEPGKAYTIRGGFLDRVDRFEPEVFGISPREALGMDPQQRIALEVSWEALERAGYAPDSLEGSRTGVYVGLSTTDYVRLRQQVGDVRDVDAYQLVGEPSFTAGRISYVLGLRGPSKVLDTSCSSSLVAVHEAAKALRLRECDLALAGGVNLMLSPYGFVIMSKFRALAPDGRCKTFDASADGYARGEGVGMVVLKRLADAQADHDDIVAVLRGSAVNHDGRSSGLTVPNPAAQQDVIRAALAQAQLDPSEVDYVEAHGTGTALGDPIELRALSAVLGRGRPDDQPLLVGSVKTNIGHLESAAGIAGLIKVALAIRHGEVPPSLHFTDPNPNVEWDRLHVQVAARHAAWPERGRPRVGAVSSFGASGTNAHAVLASAPAVRAPSRSPRQHGLFLASARTPEALRELAARDAARLRGDATLELFDACFASHVGRATQAYGLAVVASTVDALADGLARFADTGTSPGVLAATLPPFRQRTLRWRPAPAPPVPAELAVEPAYPDGGLDAVWRAWGIEPPEGDGLVLDAPYDQRSLLEALGRLCLHGIRPDWTAYHAIEEVSRVPLPTTPWRGTSYWFREAEPSTAGSLRGGAAGTVDIGVPVPGVGRRLPSASLAYEVDVPVRSAGAVVALALAGVRDGLGGRFTAIEDLAVTGYPAVDGAVQLLVGADGAWRLVGRTGVESAAGAPWHGYATGVARRRLPEPPVPPSTLPAAPSRTLPAADGHELQPGPDAVRDWVTLLDTVTAATGAAGPVAIRCAGLSGTDLGAVHRIRLRDGDAELVAADGRRVGFVRSLTVSALDEPSSVWHPEEELRYVLDWQPVPAVTAPAVDLSGRGFLVLSDRHGTADGLAAELAARGAAVLVADPPDPDGVRPVLDSWAADCPHGTDVLVLTGLDAPMPEHADPIALDTYAADADLLAIALVRQLTDARVTLVTRGAVPAGRSTAVNPTANTLWGLARVLVLEHPERWRGIVDLDPAGGTGGLVEVLAGDPTEDQVALRGGRRYVPRVVPAPARPGEPVAIRADGTYLVTGGLGGIGLALAQWLATEGAGRLVLLSRKATDDHPAVRRLRESVDVEVVAADVTDGTALTALFARLAADPRPLRGICHAAGLSDPQFVRDVTPERYAAVWRPKVVGGWLLHQLSMAHPLDFFLGFSSIAAIWGSQHLASYAAGNAYLDGLAHHRRALGLPALTVAWGPWDLPSSLFGAEVMSFLKATGLRPLAAPQCVRLLGGLLADPAVPQQVVCAVDWSVFRPVMQARTPRPMLHAIEVAEETGTGTTTLSTVDDAGRYLRDVLATVLGADPAGLSDDADVMAYGLDSLMAMEVVRRCKRDLGVGIQASDLFERTTLGEWTALLAGAAVVAQTQDWTDPARIAVDVRLDPAIRSTGTAPRPADPEHVLLTGATGFVGAYLLHELLATTRATVHCLVRGTGGRQRIRANLERYLPWPDGADGRIVVVEGDLSRPGLGVDDFDGLADTVESVYHNGAWVNFSYTYEQLRDANITGTQEILRLACTGRPKGVHHVSTYGIWGIPADGRAVVAETDDIAGAGRLVTGYVQTKWAAERLVRQGDLPVDVYRPGRVLGDSRTGACLTTHFTTRVIKGCVQLGLAPDIDLEVEMTPVDYVAAALVRISLRDRDFGQTYHLVNPRKMSFAELSARLRESWPIETVPVGQWWQALRDTYGDGTNELHPVLGVVEEFVVGGEDAIRYDVGNTEEALRGTGISCPPLDTHLLDTYLRWLVQTGYLPSAPRGTRT
jgi:thioester reductase-like protein